MQSRLLPDFDQIDPVAVRAGQILLVLDPLVEIGQILLIDGKAMQRIYGRCCAVRGTRAACPGGLDLVLRLLRNCLLGRRLGTHLLLQDVMPLSERVCCLLGLIDRLLQLLCLISQCVPSCDLSETG